MTSSKISSVALLLLAFLLPIFFLPTTLVPIPLAKTFVVLLFVVVTTGVIIVRAMRSKQVTLPWNLFFLSALLIPLAYLLSSIFSGSPLSIFGYGLEVGTSASIVLAMLLMLGIVLAVRDTRDIFRMLGAFFLSGVLVVVFGIVKILSKGNIFTFQVFSGNMGNPIGSWTDYGILFACLILLALLAVELLELRKAMRVSAYAVMTLSTLLLMVINFSVAWILLAIFSLILLAYFATMNKRTEEVAPKKPRRLSKAALVVFLVSLLFIFNPSFGSKGDLRNLISTHFEVQNIDVRPSVGSTSTVSSAILKSDPFFGSGPNTFGEDWLLYKTADLNSTPFWNVSFPFGLGFFPTQIASSGLLGTLLWIAFLVLFILIGFKALMQAGGKRERFVLVSSLMLSAFLIAAFFVYVPSVVIFYLAFICMGLFLAAAEKLGVLRMRTIVFAGEPVRSFIAVLVCAFVGIGVVALAFVSSERAISVFYYQKALALSSVSGASADAVEADMNKALAFSKQDIYYRSISDIDLAQAQAIVGGSSGTDAEKSQAFENALSGAITAAQSAISVNPNSYSNWTALGSIYADLVPPPLSVDGAYDNAKKAFAEAAKRNPLSPEVPLLLARLDYSNGDIVSARKDIADAVALKADYADAYFLLTQIEIGQNDVPNAISAAKTAALLSPDNAGIYFELGLLEYTSGNYTAAAEALTQAVTIVPTYANAKYFLGLSLDKLGQHNLALVQFEDLLKSNPGNADLPIIIANIEAGKDPLYQAPSGSHPEKEVAPPIDSTTEATQ